jgi:type IV pilus assembly protein PilV
MTPRPFQARPHASAASRGASLIEVLIAVLILAIGMLGVAALQSSALRNSQSSLERSQAVIYTYTMLDAMRSNADVARSQGYNMAMVPGTCTPPAAAANLSANDRRMWIQSMQGAMGNTACGDINCALPGVSGTSSCVVRVRWDDSRAGGSSANERIVSTVTEL